MKKYYYIVYAIFIVVTLLLFLFWKDMSDSFMLLLAAFVFILTSIFSYSKRK